MSHRAGEPPGASPAGTTYWHGDVLVSLTLVVDGAVITEAVRWGVERGRTDFQLVVMSLFQVALVEVFLKNGQPFVRASEAVNLSPLRAEDCMSTHPRERPELKPGMAEQPDDQEDVMPPDCMGTPERLRDSFPGLVSLVNFFNVAGSRCKTFKSFHSAQSYASQGAIVTAPVVLPPEMHDRILDFVDYKTWKACLAVSPRFRSYCLRKFRLDNRVSILAGPFVVNDRRYPRLSFDFENAQTGEVSRRGQISPRNCGERLTEEYNWMSLIGNNRKALMTDVSVQFEKVPMPSSMVMRRLEPIH
jgi:hypothetical protein